MSKRVDLRLIVIGDMYGVINTCGDLLCYCETIKDCKERLKIKYDFTPDFTETLYDRERDNYMTADILRKFFFEDKDAVERFNGDFSAYFDECTGKNGTLEIIERQW